MSKLQRYSVAVGCISLVSLGAFLLMKRNVKNGGHPTTEKSQATLAERHSGYTRLEIARLPSDVDIKGREWDSELLHTKIKQCLEFVRSEIRATALGMPGDSTAELVSAQFQCSALRPSKVQVAYQDSRIVVNKSADELVPDGSMSTQSFNDFPTAINDLLTADARFQKQPPSDVDVHLKVIGIQLEGTKATSRVLVEINRRNSQHIGSVVATWECAWQVTEEQPKLAQVRLQEYEDVQLESGTSLLEDVTARVVRTSEANRDQWLRGIDHWSRRLTHIEDMRMHGHHGIAIADVNGDGLEDIYACDAGGLPNRLFVQQPDGSTIDDSARSKADWLESSTAALFVDFDNDGDQDLAVATVAGIVIAANDGSGRFEPRNAIPGMREAHSICAADYDNDGDVDIYACVYGRSSAAGTRVGFEASLPIPHSDANNGGTNVLLRNDGGFRFVDATTESGLDANNQKWSFAAAWNDFDRDGDVDLYVANDFGRNNLYENIGGQFRDIAAERGVEDRAGGMSAAWADFNRDGDQDLYVGNMYSAAGQRVTFQPRFLDGRQAVEARNIQRMARGNSLFTALGSGKFRDASLSSNASMGRWAWGSRPVDLNNDGYDDIVVANGYFTNPLTDDL